jgi:hypothetical protein
MAGLGADYHRYDCRLTSAIDADGPAGAVRLPRVKVAVEVARACIITKRPSIDDFNPTLPSAYSLTAHGGECLA